MPLPPSPGPAPGPGTSSSAAARARRHAAVALVAAILVCVLLTWAVATGGAALEGFDSALTDFTRGWADPGGPPVALAHLVGLVTAPFWSALAAGALVIWLLVTRHLAAGAMLALSGVAGVSTSEIVKTLMGRTRPPGAEQFESDLDKSFPSGHSMEGIYLYLAVGLILIHLGRAQGRRGVQVIGAVLVLIGPMIGLSRLVLGVHWPSDIAAGWAFGSVVLLLSALLLWWPLDRGWRPVGGSTPAAGIGTALAAVTDPGDAQVTPPRPSGGPTPDPPVR